MTSISSPSVRLSIFECCRSKGELAERRESNPRLGYPYNGFRAVPPASRKPAGLPQSVPKKLTYRFVSNGGATGTRHVNYDSAEGRDTLIGEKLGKSIQCQKNWRPVGVSNPCFR